jgi:flagellar motor protein MotB
MPALEEEDSPPIWAAVSDLMACLFGLFVLFFVWMVMTQVVLGRDLQSERDRLAATRSRLDALESALAGPLASGLITLVDGRIGIRGAVLFASSEAELRPEGKELLQGLAGPLGAFLKQHQVALMISGFTDDKPVKYDGEFIDNWELSAQRALTVTRALIEAGLPPDSLIAAGFGEHHPVAPNESAEQRAQNRRVEIAPVPLPSSFRAQPSGAP